MNITYSTEKARVPVTVVHVDGSIDSASYEAFQAKADELIKNGARHILVDLAHAPYVSSAGLRALNNIFNSLRALTPDVSDEEMHKAINAGSYKSSQLKLLNPTKAALVALETSGFSMFIDSFTDLKTALASF